MSPNQVVRQMGDLNVNDLFFTVVAVILSISIFLIFRKYIMALVKRISRRFNQNQTSSKVAEHLQRLVNATSSKDNPQIDTLIVTTLVLFVPIAILLTRQGYGLMGIVMAALIAFMPYCNLWIRLSRRRTKASFEGEKVIAELLNQYKMNYFNMPQAIEVCVVHLVDAPICRQIFFKMSLRLKKTKNDDEIRKIIDELAYGVNTQWAKMLANNMVLAISDSVEVTEGLEDILADCKEIAELIETGKRKNSEPTIMIFFLPPILYIGLAYMSMKSMDGMTLKTIIGYQLFTPNGVIMFMLAIITSFINYALISLIGQRKYDF